ncbi:hypothetical protein C1645_836156 [Glomus cerebriforme]|uniref:Uncharacterized protein n=1 Tax=Glomus cerebriforme TaxID=658196 RepID=A0A397S6C5_9GLOM|nr:hypothetical protein C1645_836156 [Glomus cerebriforme]
MKEITLAIQYMPYPHIGDAIQKMLEKIIIKWKLQDKPYINIVISSLNVSKNHNAKEDAKRLQKINLTNDKWDVIRDLLKILGPFAELTEKLEGTKYAIMSYIYPGISRLKKLFRLAREYSNNNLDLETNDNAFEEYQFEEIDEDYEPEVRRKIQINTPVNTSGLIDKQDQEKSL